MKLASLVLITLSVLSASNTQTEVRTAFVAAKDAFAASLAVGPMPNRFNVWVRPNNENVVAIRVSVHYEYDGKRTIVSRVVEADAENGTVASFVVPDVSVKVLTVNITELAPANSFDAIP